jgi:[protein-PII] uridylyltransferase
VHRFTLDRHLVQAAYEAAAYTREVERPDLLLIGAFLHDVGKGLEGDHSVVGAPVAAEIATRIGLPPADVATIEKLVRLHLLLPDVATRRDLSDPVTISTVAGAVGDSSTLDLLHALARADSHATGPAAWSDWKGRLMAELVRRVHTALDTGALPDPPEPDPELLEGDLPAVHLDGDRVAVAAADRRGLLASVAACLAMHRLDVVACDASTVDGRAIVEFWTQPRYGSPADPVALAADLRRVAAGDVSVTQRLRARAMSQRGHAASPRVVWQRGAATGAVILELRAADSSGLLYRIATALDDTGAEVRAARISTLGGDVVDAFYLIGAWDDEAERDRVEAALLAAV